MSQLIIRQGDGTVTVRRITTRSMSLGRLALNDVVIEDREASRLHAILSQEDDGLTLTDLESTNGTWVNGRLVHGAALQTYDLIRIGGCEIMVSEDGVDGAFWTHGSRKPAAGNGRASS